MKNEKIIHKSWRYRTLVLAPSIVANSIVILPASASAQRAPQLMQEALQRKYDILQQQANTDSKNAESERMRAESERSRITSQRSSSSENRGNYTVTDGDALEGAAVATYLATSGVTLKTTGIFRPDAPTRCIAYCGPEQAGQ